jgi:effector-binding domain-containing protein
MMIGKIFLQQSFDLGLANLKKYIEANPPALTGMSEIIIDTFDPAITMVAESPGTMDETGEIMGELFGKVMTEVAKQGLIPQGPPFSIYSEWDEAAGTFVITAGIVVDRMGIKAGDVFPRKFEEWTGAVGKHTGPYEEMEPSYMKLEQYVKDNNLETTGEAIEIYLNDPMRVSDPNALETLIAFPLK